jgi:LmbE family N-acetylglucosaminyl deacetylase
MKDKCVSDLGRPAIVFAPHPDDETLGCGGTILRKLAQGAKVEVIYLTDGSHSHDALPAKELARIRHAEALKACVMLGLDERRVHFFDLEDGLLAQHEAEALAGIRAILASSEAEEVFVTHREEPSPDHAAANRVVRKVVQELGRPMTVWEYLIWYWNSWPWLRFDPGSWHHPYSYAMAIARGLPKLTLGACNCAVDVSQQLEAKRAALAQHRTQVTRYNGEPSWGILSDIAQGRFLEMLLQPQELFLRYEIPTR